MITLQELFDDLAASELANVKMGNSALDTLTHESYPKVVSALNLALVEIYKRLNLREGEVNLHQYSGVTKYYLRSDYAETVDYMDEDYYLEQTDEEPFADDVLKILSAVDSAGDEVHINNVQYPADIFTPEFDCIKIAGPSTTIMNYDGVYRTVVDIFTIKYRAKYPKIVITESFDPENTKLHIPDFIEQALLIYIAYKLFRKPVKIARGEVNPSTTLLIEFENEMAKLEHLDLPISVEDESTKFENNGWV